MCQGYECRAVPLALVAVLPSFFEQLIAETFVLSVFLLEMWARMFFVGVFGMQWNMLMIIITHTPNRPFSCVVTVGQ